jgi:hypothetical protein
VAFSPRRRSSALSRSGRRPRRLHQEELTGRARLARSGESSQIPRDPCWHAA